MICHYSSPLRGSLGPKNPIMIAKTLFWAGQEADVSQKGGWRAGASGWDFLTEGAVRRLPSGVKLREDDIAPMGIVVMMVRISSSLEEDY